MQVGRKKFDEAILNFEKALEDKTHDSNCVLMYAKCLIDCKKDDEAYKLLSNEIEAKKNKSKELMLLYYLRADILQKQSKFSEALDDLNEALKISKEEWNDNQSTTIRYLRAQVHVKLGNFQEGLNDLQFNFPDTNFYRLTLLRSCYIGLGKNDEALKVFFNIKSFGTLDFGIEILFGIYETFLLIGRTDKANKALEKYNPKNYEFGGKADLQTSMKKVLASIQKIKQLNSF